MGQELSSKTETTSSKPKRSHLFLNPVAQNSKNNHQYIMALNPSVGIRLAVARFTRCVKGVYAPRHLKNRRLVPRSRCFCPDAQGIFLNDENPHLERNLTHHYYCPYPSLLCYPPQNALGTQEERLAARSSTKASRCEQPGGRFIRGGCCEVVSAGQVHLVESCPSS